MLFSLLWACGGGQPLQQVQGEAHVQPLAIAADAPADGGIVNCASGCAAPDSAHDFLGDDKIVELLQTVATEPVGEASISAETLLFHGAETLDVLARVGSGSLSNDHLTWLKTELDRDELYLQIRMVNDDGKVLGQRQDTIPIAEKQHLVLRDTNTLGRLSINGKAKRVGVEHLWARF